MNRAWNLAVVNVLVSLILTGVMPFVVRAEWQRRESGTFAWLHAVKFLDEAKGFAAGSNGTLLSTNDGGVTWKKVSVPVTDTFRDVHFLDDSIGWLLCDRGKFGSGRNASYLLRTDDGGESWSIVELEGGAERSSRLFFARDGSGYLIGEGGIFSTLPTREEKGVRHVLPTRFLMTDGTAPEGTMIVLTGGGGSLIVSRDGGRRWQPSKFADVEPVEMLNTVFFTDPLSGWAAGNRGLILSTNDGGRIWRRQASMTESNLYAIAFFDKNEGIAVGEGGAILRTSDSGSRWRLDRGPSKHRLDRLAFAGRRAVAVGFGGTIISIDLYGPRNERIKEK